MLGSARPEPAGATCITLARADGITLHRDRLAMSRAVGVEVVRAPIRWLSPSPGGGVNCQRQAAGAGAGFVLSTLGGYLLSVWIGLFGFKEIRTGAGIVAG